MGVIEQTPEVDLEMGGAKGVGNKAGRKEKSGERRQERDATEK